MIYCIGNSHANVFTNTHPAIQSRIIKSDFVSCSIGPVIAYNFLENHFHKVLNILESSNFNKKIDYVMLIVGEVDCRWHLPKKSNDNDIDHHNIVEECIDRFFNNYLELKSKGYNVIGWGGHPSTINGHDDNPDQPVFGNCLARNAISRTWDKLLKSKCELNNIPYISIMENLIDDNGFTKMEYFMDYCHLNYSKVESMLIDKFKDFIKS
jgi:hypothetical protein